MLPLVKWPGGKRRELGIIRQHLPEYRRYFEPFLGGGALWLDQVPARSYLNDSHALLIALYRYIQSKDVEFREGVYDFTALWEGTRRGKRSEIYYQTRERYNQNEETDCQKVIDFWILRELAYGGMFRFNSNGGFNVPFAGSYAEKDMNKKASLLLSAEITDIMENAVFYQEDFHHFLTRFKFKETDFVFLDPPYHCDFTKYGDDDFTEDDHLRLADTLRTLQAKFMLVIQKTDFVDETYTNDGYSITEYDKKYSFNIRGRNKQATTHLMITNYGAN